MTTLEAALNKLAKWRTVYAGWQLGTRPKGDPESDAIRDHRELTLILRAEVTALQTILLQKEVFTLDEWATTLADEARQLDEALERRFPGFTTSLSGVDINVEVARQTMKGWKP